MGVVTRPNEIGEKIGCSTVRVTMRKYGDESLAPN